MRDGITGFVKKVDLRERSEQRPDRFAIGESRCENHPGGCEDRKVSLSIKAREVEGQSRRWRISVLRFRRQPRRYPGCRPSKAKKGKKDGQGRS